MGSYEYPDYAMGDHDWLLTRTDVPSCDDILQGTEPVQPFTVPPLPPQRQGSRRYAQIVENINMNSVFTDWEKRAIVSRLRRCEPLNEENFLRRLSNVKARNEVEYLENVRMRGAELKARAQNELRAAYEHERPRREYIFRRHLNLKNVLIEEVRQHRAARWYTIITSHVFLTVLIKERRDYEAMEKIKFRLLPIIKRRLAVQRKRMLAAELTRDNLDKIPFPTPSVIHQMQGTFFDGWPNKLLEQLGHKARPLYLKEGSYLMHEGDVDRCMYMITAGTISVIMNDREKGKRRIKENSKACFTLSPPCYVGEFALVCKEPRSASIICETDVGVWSVPPEGFEEVAQQLSQEIKSKQREATDVRRRANLQRFFPLRVEFLRSFPYFVQFSNAALENIISKAEPIVLHNNDHLFSKSELDPSAYFIQDGVAVLLEANGNQRLVPRGSCVGIFECACSVNERKKCTIISQNYCDIWRISREALMDVGMSEPAAFLYCRGAAKSHRAMEVEKPCAVPRSLSKDPFIQFCLTRQLMMRMWEMSVPTIFLNDEKLVIQGQKFQRFVIIHSGVCETTISTEEGEYATVRITVSGDASPGGDVVSPYESISRRRSLADKLFISRILGAYEYASLKTHYTYTVTSYGLTEAFLVDVAAFEKSVPPELKAIMHNNKKSQELISLCQTEHNASYLTNSVNQSFVHLYRKSKEFMAKR